MRGRPVALTLAPVSYTHLDVYKRQELPGHPDNDEGDPDEEEQQTLGLAVAVVELRAGLQQGRREVRAPHHRGVGEGAEEDEVDHEPGGLGAVSYTHLDVYKRQAVTAGPSTRDAGRVAQPSAGRWATSVRRSSPVSYTHLDVYKRQPRGPR